MGRIKTITLGSTHLDVNESFKEHLRNELNNNNSTYTYHGIEFSQEDIDYCDNLLSKFINKHSISSGKPKKGKRGGKRNRKKKKYDDIYSFWDDESYSHGSEDDFYGCVDTNSKNICYYRDVNQPDDYEEFFNLYSFQKFLETEGVEVDDAEYNDLMNRYCTHCCINPKERLQNGKLKLMTADTYGTLRWDYSDIEETVKV